MESVIRENESLHTTVRKLISRIAEHDAAAVVSQLPGISPFLQALIRSAIKNAHRKQGRFDDRELVLISSHFFMVAGRQAYTDLYLNLKKIIPCVSTVLRMIDKSKFILQPGQFAFKQLLDFLTARSLPLVVNVGIDGTRCVAKIQYDPATNQLVGFVPELIDGVPALQPFPATSEQVIRRYFETETPGSIISCIVARPLERNAPSFCLCAFPTDNKFLASDVLKLYEYIESSAGQYGIRIAAHGSDGDPRFLAAMRERMFPPCNNSLAWRFWFRSSFATKVPCVQDPTHIGTKLRNLLLRSHEMHMGDFLVSPSHLIFLVEEVSKDQHEITLSDIDPKDRMNYRSMEKICSQKVIDLLRDTVPDSEGTCVYLEMARAAITSYLDRSLVPSERLFLIWKATFFYRAWRKWVQDQPSLTLKTSFLTSNAYTCIEINAHALVLLIQYHRDHLRDKDLGELLTWRFGSQDNEELFRALRSMTSTFSTVINFTPLECIHRISRATLEKDIQQELGPKYKFSGSRRAAKKKEDFIPEQGDLPSNSEILEIVDNAKKDAQVVLRKLGMGANAVTNVFDSLPEVEIDSDEETDEPQNVQAAVESTSQEPPDEGEMDCMEDLAVSSMFSGEVQLRTYEKEVTPDSPYVVVKNFYGQGAVVKKSSLVWMLSTRGAASNDRTMRFRLPTATAPTPTGNSSRRSPVREEYAHLGDWCVFQESSKGPMYAGRLLQFHYLTGHCKKYTLRSAPTTVPQGTRPRGIGIVANLYSINSLGMLERTQKTSVSMDAYKYTINRPRIVGNELHLDIRTLSMLPL